MLSGMLARRLPASINAQKLAFNIFTPCRNQVLRTPTRFFSALSPRHNISFRNSRCTEVHKAPSITRLAHLRFSSTGTVAASSSAESSPLPEDCLPILSPPPVARWLLLSSALVFAVIVVGGVTRLTESGLSITEWKPVSGMIPPLTDAQWEEEFNKYKATPEYKLCVYPQPRHAYCPDSSAFTPSSL